MSNSNYKSPAQPGITIIEIIVAIVIASAVALGLVTTLTHILTNKGTDMEIVHLTKTAQDAIDSIADDMRQTTNFLRWNNLSHDNIDTTLSPNFRGKGVNQRQLILEQVAPGHGHYSASDAEPIYLKRAGQCDVLVVPITVNIIYYMQQEDSSSSLYTLYRRTLDQTQHPEEGGPLAPESLCRKSSTNPVPTPRNTTCSKNAVRPSCAGRKKDVVIAENVTQFSIDYYSSPSDTNPYGDAYSRPTRLRDASAIRVRLKVTGDYPHAPSIKRDALLIKGLL